MYKQARERFRYLKIFILLAGLALAGRLIQVQVFQHPRHLARARKTWTDDLKIYPVRGNLYDRDRKPLAVSVATWRVGVSTSLLGDDTQEVSDLLGEMLHRDPKSLRERFAAAGGQHVVVAASQVLTRHQMMQLQGQKAITVEDLRARIYPADGLAASLIGFHRQEQDSSFSTGLENSLRDYLDGSPGKARLITTGNLGQNLGQVVLQEARHGQNLVLSLDSDLEEICETRLAEAISTSGSIGGSVLVLEPGTGDVLVAASWPLMKTRQGRHSDAAVWNNRNFTNMYEPGSVFKIFTAASLLRHGAVDTAMVFDCSNSDFGSFQIHNDEGHAYGYLSLMEAFAKSSNIYFARTVGNLRAEELYHDLLDFGFGQDAGVPYAGSLKGILKNPASWSGRTRATMAIGQEVAVTPLQLGLAGCVVANGGTLYAPRLIREVLDEHGDLVEEIPPRPLRRVLPEPLAELLRQAMAGVVDHGTGIGARETWITTGGKTGTAQKSRDGRVYAQGAYVASFLGLVPADEPRLVILTILDEPQGIKHYASQSAVPLFRDIVRDIRSGTEYLTGVPGAQTAPLHTTVVEDLVPVPDLLQLSLENAAQKLGAAGLVMAGTEHGGMVVQQIPLPGTRVEPGSSVYLTTGRKKSVESGTDLVCPDLAGLSNRQVRGLSARLGLDVEMIGTGYVVQQTPAAGTVLKDANIQVKMEAKW